MKAAIDILLIEDDADDIELLEDALRSNNVSYNLNSIKEGDRVHPYLLTLGTLPDIIILDFNLPKLHGKEILTLIKASQNLKEIPVIVLTTSAREEDILFSKNMGAAHFITKPTTLQDFDKAIATIVKTAAAF